MLNETAQVYFLCV